MREALLVGEMRIGVEGGLFSGIVAVTVADPVAMSVPAYTVRADNTWERRKKKVAKKITLEVHLAMGLKLFYLLLKGRYFHLFFLAAMKEVPSDCHSNNNDAEQQNSDGHKYLYWEEPET